MLIKCAQTSLNSKLLNSYKVHFSELVVQAIEKLDPTLLDKDLVGIKSVIGGSITVRLFTVFFKRLKTLSPLCFLSHKIVLL